ncbi:MAG TPA: hypothetical protein VN736_30665, partial [Candidatus Limnocylindrales bacterium]|nr:hypothetical protein [Candidatus Limnocylindrales bacterium]
TECGTAAYSLQSGILNRSAITNQPRADDQILSTHKLFAREGDSASDAANPRAQCALNQAPPFF